MERTETGGRYLHFLGPVLHMEGGAGPADPSREQGWESGNSHATLAQMRGRLTSLEEVKFTL